MSQIKEHQGDIAIIGAGVIGKSWAATFLAGGYGVRFSDPNEKAKKGVYDELPGFLKEVPGTDLSDADVSEMMKRVLVTDDLDEALKDVVAVQENGPEDPDFKADIFAKIEERAAADTLLFSSSSGIVPDKIGAKMKSPNRVVIGHPFNPPHMLPLVEICGTSDADPEHLKKAAEFYRKLGKAPAILAKPIPGFVANRLQCALCLEAVRIVEDGVVDVETLDYIMLNSLGPRWASVGPLLAGHMGGGEGGLGGIIEHILNSLAKGMGQEPISEETIDDIGKKAFSVYPKSELKRLTEERDVRTAAILELRTSGNAS